ncbi:hypothetical protein IMSAGC012_00426 [Lachnospiraceae bacterium]|nr:hypothetical protein IMSAGC012_00426 [Lachnospiraceae bacterium]
MKIKKMKKTVALVMSVLLLFGLAACGNEKQGAGGSSGQNSSSESADADVAESEKPEESKELSSASDTDGAVPNAEDGENTGGKTLVVYYSASGNTEEAAGYIAAATGGELFELEPKEAYTDADLDWTDEDSRVCREHENEDERKVELISDTVPDWDSYETVFIGYPIWWGIAAWPVDGFIAANDFTGKTVIPFCTSASSGLGESGDLLEEMAGTGDWLAGERFSSGVSEEDVKAWVDGLGL